jgi:hypothetical protein
VDGHAFDQFTRSVARRSTSRRGLLRGAAVAVAVMLVGPETGFARRAVGSTCRENADCFSGICGPRDRWGRRRCLCTGATDCPLPRPCHQTVCEAGTCTERSDDGAPCRAAPCTEGAVCRQGICAGAPKDCSALDGPCTVGVCSPAIGTCEAANRPDDTVCSSAADACTHPSTCRDGVCVAGNPKDCSALDGPCAVGVCNRETGDCERQPINEGGACSGDDLCLTSTCQSGACVGRAPVDCSRLDTTCRQGVCDPSTGACISQVNPLRVGQPCDDGNACTEGTVCQADGTCGGGTAVTCIDPPECQDFPAICDPSRGCLYSTGDDGQTCDAGAGLCLSGSCLSCRPAGTRICPDQLGWLCCSAVCGTDPLNAACCICA